MSIDLVFTPSGRIAASGRVEEGARPDKVAKAFASSQAEGLFSLATDRSQAPLTPAMAYWRDFAGRYLTELCHTPESTDSQLIA